jgi:hypothetical protein
MNVKKEMIDVNVHYTIVVLLEFFGKLAGSDFLLCPPRGRGFSARGPKHGGYSESGRIIGGIISNVDGVAQYHLRTELKCILTGSLCSTSVMDVYQCERLHRYSRVQNIFKVHTTSEGHDIISFSAV